MGRFKVTGQQSEWVPDLIMVADVFCAVSATCGALSANLGPTSEAGWSVSATFGTLVRHRMSDASCVQTFGLTSNAASAVCAAFGSLVQTLVGRR